MQSVHERFRGLLDRNGRAWFCFLVLSRHLGFRLDMLCSTFVLALSLLSVRGYTNTGREWPRWVFSEGMRKNTQVHSLTEILVLAGGAARSCGQRPHRVGPHLLPRCVWAGAMGHQAKVPPHARHAWMSMFIFS